MSQPSNEGLLAAAYGFVGPLLFELGSPLFDPFPPWLSSTGSAVGAGTSVAKSVGADVTSGLGFVELDVAAAALASKLEAGDAAFAAETFAVGVSFWTLFGLARRLRGARSARAASRAVLRGAFPALDLLVRRRVGVAARSLRSGPFARLVRAASVGGP